MVLGTWYLVPGTWCPVPVEGSKQALFNFIGYNQKH